MSKEERLRNVEAKRQKLTGKLTAAISRGAPDAEREDLANRITHLSRKLADLGDDVASSKSPK
jgi:hypothetical protein